MVMDYKKSIQKVWVWLSMIEKLKSIKLTALPFYDDKYFKTKIKTNRKKINPGFYDLGVPKDGIECKCAELIFIDSLFTRENITCKYIYMNAFINLQRKIL